MRLFGIKFPTPFEVSSFTGVGQKLTGQKLTGQKLTEKLKNGQKPTSEYVVNEKLIKNNFPIFEIIVVKSSSFEIQSTIPFSLTRIVGVN